MGIAAGWRRQWALVLHWRRWAELDTQEMVRAGQITQLMPFHVHPGWKWYHQNRPVGEMLTKDYKANVTFHVNQRIAAFYQFPLILATIQCVLVGGELEAEVVRPVEEQQAAPLAATSSSSLPTSRCCVHHRQRCPPRNTKLCEILLKVTRAGVFAR